MLYFYSTLQGATGTKTISPWGLITYSDSGSDGHAYFDCLSCPEKKKIIITWLCFTGLMLYNHYYTRRSHEQKK